MTNPKRKSLDLLYARLETCDRCHLCVTRTHALRGQGDVDAKFMLIALSPGEKEDRANTMFIGPTGAVLDRLFDAIRITRESVYMTNLIKCLLPKNRRPKMEEIEICSYHLDEELSIIQPEVIVPLGFYATRYIFDKYHYDAPSARKDFARLYGKLIYSDEQKIYPLPHPSSLLYNPSFEDETIEKYNVLNILSHDCKWHPICPMKRFYEQGRLDSKWIELYCKGDWSRCVRFQMEERGQYHPNCMRPDGSIDETLKIN